MSKVGRNDKCPCGSGKKYKKCCLNENMSESDFFQKMSEPNFPQRFFLFSDEQEDPVGMISEITEMNIQSLVESSGFDFKIGDWFVSIGACDSLQMSKPLKDMDSAINFAQENVNFNRLVSEMDFS